MDGLTKLQLHKDIRDTPLFKSWRGVTVPLEGIVKASEAAFPSPAINNP
jgi:hypothetical protein